MKKPMKYSSTISYLSDNTSYPERELIDLTNFMIKADQDLKNIFYGVEFEPSTKVINRIFTKIRSGRY